MNSTRADERIRAYVRETPLVESGHMGASAGTRLVLKLENRQETGSFKMRGATNKLLTLPRAQTSGGVVAASSGNHALGVATIGRKLGIPVEIFLSKHVHPVKRRRIEAIGARVREIQGDELAAELAARDEAEASGRPNVSPYNDSDVIEGQGTIAVEMLRQLAERRAEKLDAVFVAVGGGGLISGIGSHLEEASPETQVVGCWPENSDVMFRCMEAGEIRDFPYQTTWSTSTAGGVEPNAITLELCRRVIDRSVLVTENEILAAARQIWRDESQLVEGAAAVAVAAFMKTSADYAGKTVAIVICGGNANPDFERRIRQD